MLTDRRRMPYRVLSAMAPTMSLSGRRSRTQSVMLGSCSIGALGWFQARRWLGALAPVGDDSQALWRSHALTLSGALALRVLQLRSTSLSLLRLVFGFPKSARKFGTDRR
jgi:hypothetical protein